MYLIIAIVLLAVLGTIDSAYLYYKHLKKEPLYCPIGGQCDAVVTSKWSATFGLRNELLGIVYYLIVLAAAGLLVSMPKYYSQIRLVLSAVTGGGFLFSVFLTYLQFGVIKKYCFYCLLSSGVSISLFAAALALK